jgi:hypothetical protein
MKNRTILSALFFLSIIYFSCRKENDDSTESTSPSARIQATIAGVVVGENNIPVAGVTVTTDDQQTVTDPNGFFIFNSISVERKRCLLTYEKQGFFTSSKGIIPSSDNLNYTKIILLTKAAVDVISSPAGGKVNITSTASVEFQPSSFVDQSGNAYSGSVIVFAKHLSPDDENFSFSFPGGDLIARDQSDKEVVLYSYGMMGVELKGSGGQSLQLASGKSATLTFPIAPDQLASAPATIPLWYFDEKDQLWIEDGVAVKTGNKYVGTVSHFTWWNCDYPGDRANITGTVVDCNNNPIPNVVVTVNSNYTITTNQAGNYSGFVPAALALTFEVLPGSNSGLSSQLITISPLITGENKQIPNLVIQCPSHITGNLVGCNNQTVNGNVAIFSQSQLLNYTISSGGAFDIVVPPNTLITLKSTVNSITQSNTILSQNMGTTTNAGTITLCGNNVPTDNSFVLNGDGYNNDLIGINSLMLSEATYHTSSQNTSCNNTGTGPSGAVYLDLYFPGNATGTFTLHGTPGYVDGYINIISQNKQYQGSNSGNNNQLSITVTEYGAVGEKIKGTFSGSLSRWDGNNWVYVTISNGKFSYTRVQDALKPSPMEENRWHLK